MTTLQMLASATGPDTAVCAVEVTTGPVRVALVSSEPAPDQPLVSPVYSGSTAVDAQGNAKVSVSGLSANTRYWWRVEDNGTVDDSRTGTFLTYPLTGVASTFTFTASGDAGQTPSAPGFTNAELEPERISNHEVHALIGSRMRSEGWLFHLDLGDITYYDLGNTGSGFPAGTLANYRTMWDDLHRQPNQRVLFDSGSFVHVWDDHDYGPNDSDGTYADKANAATAFRERNPHHDLPDSGAIYRSFQVGRALVVVWDCRYERSPIADVDSPSKTMLGSAQKSWFQGLIQSTTAEVVFIVSSVQWMSGGAGGWAGYTYERQELADMITAAGKASRVVMLSADAHVLAIDSGGNNQWGGWPCAIFACRDATTGTLVATYDQFGPQSDRAQYGTVTVTDLGSLITVKLTAWKGSVEQASYTKAFPVAVPASTVDIPDVISGSHRALVEARVCTEYQTGSDPVGESIPVLSGDVSYDATANVWSTLSMETAGVDEYDLTSMFPRYSDSLLAPYGNELFIRLGLDLGSEVLWTPMGYFRLDDTEQTGSSDGSIRLSGPDRWQSLIDARLISPRQYASTRTVGSVVEDLVLDVLPAAVIAWDDDTFQAPVGRDMIVEKDRAAALQDIAKAHGKVIYFDSEGILRIETAPDPTDIVWELRQGLNGCLVSSNRRVSREGMFNGVVVRGEGTVDSPAMGVAVDTGVNSPTRWGSRFGKVPKFYSSPLVSDDDQGYAAAVAFLRRIIGMPYSVDFGAVPHPGLRPRQAVRIGQKDGNREIHLIDKLRIPFLPGAVMTGATREQTFVQIGRVRPGSPDL